MPLYDFRCNKCDKVIEVIESVKEGFKPHTCPDCKSQMEMLFHNSNHMSFELKYDPKKDLVAWGNEGYARTQRYRETDKLAKHNIFT